MRHVRLPSIAIPVAGIAALLILTGCGSSASSLNRRGTELYQQADYPAARAAYEEALSARPDLPQTLYNLGNTEFRLQDSEVAGRTLEEAAAAAGAGLDAQAWYNLGNVRFAASDFPGAVDAYKETLRRDPSDADAKVNLELALRNLKQNEENQEQPPQEPTPEASPTPTPQGESTPEATPTPSDEDGGQDQATSTPEATATSEPTATPAPGEGDPSTPTLTPTPSPSGSQSPGQATPQPANPAPPGEAPVDLANGELSEEQARRILEAAANDTQTLQQALQGTYPLSDESVDKDW